MKVQWLLSLALAGGFVASNAHAIAYNKEVARCATQDQTDGSFSVTVTEHFAGLLPSVQTTYTATLERESIAGPLKAVDFDVDKSQGPGLGAPIVYEGDAISISINIDGAPVNGKHYGTVNAESVPANSQVLCDVY